MTPLDSSFCTRFQQGVWDSPTLSASSAMDRLALAWRSVSILRSIASIPAPDGLAQAGTGQRLM
jgi:hypothetical protein